MFNLHVEVQGRKRAGWGKKTELKAGISPTSARDAGQSALRMRAVVTCRGAGPRRVEEDPLFGIDVATEGLAAAA